MHHAQPQGQNLLRLEQVVQIGAGIAAADRAVTGGVDGTLVALVFGVLEVDRAVPGKQPRVAGVAGRHHAVEEIHAARHGLDDVGRRSHAHQIAGTVRREPGLDGLDDLIHHLGRFTDSQTADGVAGEVQIGHHLGVLDAKVGVSAALIDAPEHLPGIHSFGQGVQPGVLCLAANQPAVGALHRLLHVLVRGGVLHALVKGHADIGAQVGLDLHALLRAHENLPPIDVGGKVDALLPDLAQTCKGENLETAGVGQNGLVPGHKAVQAAQVADQPVAWPQMQVIGVGKLHLAADLRQILGAQTALDGSLGTDVHKHRRLNRSVCAGELAPPGTSFRFA